MPHQNKNQSSDAPQPSALEHCQGTQIGFYSYLPSVKSPPKRVEEVSYFVHYVARDYKLRVRIPRGLTVGAAKERCLRALRVTAQQTAGITGALLLLNAHNPTFTLPNPISARAQTPPPAHTLVRLGSKVYKRAGSLRRGERGRARHEDIFAPENTREVEEECEFCHEAKEMCESLGCWSKEWGLFWVDAGHWLDDSRGFDSYHIQSKETLQLQHRRNYVQLYTPYDLVQRPVRMHFAHGTVFQHVSKGIYYRWMVVSGWMATWSRSKMDSEHYNTLDLTNPFIITNNNEHHLERSTTLHPKYDHLTWTIRTLTPVEMSFTFRALDSDDYGHWTRIFLSIQRELHPQLVPSSETIDDRQAMSNKINNKKSQESSKRGKSKTTMPISLSSLAESLPTEELSFVRHVDSPQHRATVGKNNLANKSVSSLDILRKKKLEEGKVEQSHHSYRRPHPTKRHFTISHLHLSPIAPDVRPPRRPSLPSHTHSKPISPVLECAPPMPLFPYRLPPKNLWNSEKLEAEEDGSDELSFWGESTESEASSFDIARDEGIPVLTLDGSGVRAGNF
ncbi:uncharacterized protein VTP21DRAFT_7367 [Calcarisporiella thermophila]|uniref:uncharacterized protein n=1 Tax=Calcarisporiella thermophila TaxID=911321 RepID=UPI0037446783